MFHRVGSHKKMHTMARVLSSFRFSLRTICCANRIISQLNRQPSPKTSPMASHFRTGQVAYFEGVVPASKPDMPKTLNDTLGNTLPVGICFGFDT
jgi:hypothetical protein